MSNETRSEAQKTDGMSEQASRNTWRSIACRLPQQGSHGQRRDLLQGHGQRAAGRCGPVAVVRRRIDRHRERQIGTCAASRRQEFADATWKTSPLHSGLLKAYLAWGEALDNFVSQTESQRSRQGARASFHDDPRRRVGADEQPDRQSRRDPQAYQFGRPKPAERVEELSRRSRQERRPAFASRHVRLQSRGEPLQHARRGGVPQRTDRAHSICADDAQGLAATAGDDAAADQQILCDGFVARQEHRQVPARQRRSNLLRQLAQPDDRESRLGARHLCRRARRGGRRCPRHCRQRRRFDDGDLLRRDHVRRVRCDARPGESQKIWCSQSASSTPTLRPTAPSAR